MALECFDHANDLAGIPRLSEKAKEKARIIVCDRLSSLGCSPGEIYEIFEMLGIAPEEVRTW